MKNEEADRLAADFWHRLYPESNYYNDEGNFKERNANRQRKLNFKKALEEFLKDHGYAP